MIILMGHIDLDPADVAAFEEDVRAIAPIVRAEPGCLFYSLARQEATSGRMLLAQRWQDRAALAQHLQAPTTLAFQARWLPGMRMAVQQYELGGPDPAQDG
jgi:quinol monooxygenase YgiN